MSLNSHDVPLYSHDGWFMSVLYHIFWWSDHRLYFWHLVAIYRCFWGCLNPCCIVSIFLVVAHVLTEKNLKKTFLGWLNPHLCPFMEP